MARVLVADDELPTRELLRAILEGASHEVHTAENGAEALELLRRERFDLLIADVHMPVLGGVDTLKALRADPALRSIAVIVCSGSQPEDDFRMAESLGVDACLVKVNLHPKTVLAAVDRVLAKSSAED